MNKLIDSIKEEYIQDLTNTQIDAEKLKRTHLIPEEVLKKRAHTKSEENWQVMQNKFKEGISCFFDEAEKKLSAEDLSKISAEIERMESDLSKIDTQDLKHVEFKFNYDYLIESIYKIAKELIIEKHYSEAISLFYLLVIVSPQVFDFWLGLGIAYQENGNYEEALKAYETAKEVSQQEHPLPFMYMADCYQKLNFSTQARQMIDKAFELIHQFKNFSAYRAEAQNISSTI